MILNCNSCGKSIESDETCIRTLGNLYHLACQDALQPRTPHLILKAWEAVNMSDEEFRRRTGQED